MDVQRYPYEDEIDLREMVSVVLNRWKIIAAVAFISAVVAFGASKLMPKQYEASALVAITKPEAVFRFDPRITTEIELPSGSSLPDLALSDAVLREVIERLEEANVQIENKEIDEFKESLEAKIQDSILNLTTSGNDPAQIASMANIWAEVTKEKLNVLYNPISQNADLYRTQADDALKEWRATQEAIVKFEENNPERILIKQLAEAESSLSILLRTQNQLTTVLDDVRSVQGRLEGRTGNEMTDLRDDLAALLLTMRSLSSSGIWSAMPFEFSLAGDQDNFLEEYVQDQIVFLQELSVALEEQISLFEGKSEGKETKIYGLQGQLAWAREERARFEQDKQLAREAYQTLARKEQESHLASQSQESVAQVASEAAVPSLKIGPRVMLNTLIGGALGLIMGIAWAFLAKWLYEGEEISDQGK